MAYYIRLLLWKKSSQQWKLQFLFYKKKEWDVPKERWRALGFHNTMAIEDARIRARQLNSQALLKRQEERVRELELDRRNQILQNTATLPEEFVTEFELRFIRSRDSQTDQGRRKTSQSRIIWQAAQKLIIALQGDPSEWFYAHHEIYWKRREQSMPKMAVWWGPLAESGVPGRALL